MGEKVSTSVSLDPEIHERLQEDQHIVTSQLVNRFLRQYYSTGATAGVEFRLQRVERELDTAREKVARLEDQRDKLRQQVEEIESETVEKVDDVISRFDNLALDKVSEDNAAIETQAQKINMPPSELAERVRERKRR